MNSPADTLTRVEHALRFLDEAFARPTDGGAAPTRPTAVAAAALRIVLSEATLVLVRLEGAADGLSVHDDTGRRRPDWEKTLADGSSWPVAPGEVTLPASAGKSGIVLLLEPVPAGDLPGGTLGAAIPPESAPADRLAARLALRLLADQLGTRLELQRQRDRLAGCEREIEALARMADVGELAGPLNHQFNNFLNTLLLQVAVLKQTLPAEAAADLASIGLAGRKLAEQIRQVQRYRRRGGPGARVTDLNDAAAAAAAAFERDAPLSGAHAPVVRELPGRLPGPRPSAVLRLLANFSPEFLPVLACRADLQRLCALLLANAAGAVGPGGGTVELRTARRPGTVLLEIRDSGPALDQRGLDYLFDAGWDGRPGTNSLEMAAVKSLVGRLGGNIHAARPPQGGLAVAVELPAADALSP